MRGKIVDDLFPFPHGESPLRRLKELNDEMDASAVVIPPIGSGYQTWPMEDGTPVHFRGLLHESGVSTCYGACPVGVFERHCHEGVEHIILVSGEMIVHYDTGEPDRVAAPEVFSIAPGRHHRIEFLARTWIQATVIPADPEFPRERS